MDLRHLAPAPAPQSIASIIEALGTDAFEGETLRYLNATSGVEHYTVYRVRGGKPEFLGGASIRGAHAIRRPHRGFKGQQRSYEDLHAARAAMADYPGAVMMRDDIAAVEDHALRHALEHFHIVDRVVVCGRSVEDVYALAMLRSETMGEFEKPELERLEQSAEVLIAACAKHAAIHWDRSRAAEGFESVETIEGKLRTAGWGLSERELQVSARILYGISAVGIALDLGLGEETIATYRKRLYNRLRIGSRHELFQKYLKLV